MRLRQTARRLLRPCAAAAAAAVASGCVVASSQKKRFDELETHGFETQGFRPAVPYPGWDWNWDHLELTPKAIAADLGYAGPTATSADLACAIRQLFAEHYAFAPDARYKSLADVDELIEKRKEEMGGLAQLYRESYMKHAWGGAPVRHVLLVRHGQYEEHRALERQLRADVGEQHFDLEERLQRCALAGPSLSLSHSQTQTSRPARSRARHAPCPCEARAPRTRIPLPGKCKCAGSIHASPTRLARAPRAS